jgi:hypothetical protein
MVAASLIDTNVLVYRFDPRFPKKQAIATQLLRESLSTTFLKVIFTALPTFLEMLGWQT